MAGKFLEDMTSQLGADMVDTDLIYIRRPTASKEVRDIVVTWGELKSAMGVSIGAVDSVFGRSGAVVKAADDYAASDVDNDSGVTGAQVSDALDQLDTDIATKAVTSQTFFISGFISAPGNGDLDIIIKTPTAFTVTNITTKALAGSITATWKIDGTPLGGTANSVSVTEESQAHASANAVAVGQDFSVTTSADSSCTGFNFTVTLTRTLA